MGACCTKEDDYEVSQRSTYRKLTSPSEMKHEVDKVKASLQINKISPIEVLTQVNTIAEGVNYEEQQDKVDLSWAEAQSLIKIVTQLNQSKSSLEHIALTTEFDLNLIKLLVMCP